MTTSTLHRNVARAAVLTAAVMTLGLASTSPAGAQRPDDGCQAVAPAPAPSDIALVVALRKGAAARYAIEYAAELAGRS